MASDADGASKVAEGEAAATMERKRVGDTRLAGLITDWKGHMGWIQPFSKVLHPEAKRHGGLIYLGEKEFKETAGLKEGKIVDFVIYEDSDGLGAEDIKARSVLRMTLGHQHAQTTLKDSPQWSEYLSDSEYYPIFERNHGVLLRKYAWPLPFVLVELWGQPDALPGAVLALAPQPSGGKAGEGENCVLRFVLAEDDLSKMDGLPESIGSCLKVSENAVLTRPLPCRSVTIDAPRNTCAEVVKAFLAATTSVAKEGSA